MSFWSALQVLGDLASLTQEVSNHMEHSQMTPHMQKHSQLTPPMQERATLCWEVTLFKLTKDNSALVLDPGGQQWDHSDHNACNDGPRESSY